MKGSCCWRYRIALWYSKARSEVGQVVEVVVSGVFHQQHYHCPLLNFQVISACPARRDRFSQEQALPRCQRLQLCGPARGESMSLHDPTTAVESRPISMA